jgi:hypothetical protein
MDCIAPGLWPSGAQPLQCCAAAQLDSTARQSAILLDTAPLMPATEQSAMAHTGYTRTDRCSQCAS